MGNARGQGLPFRDIILVDEEAALGLRSEPADASCKRTLAEASQHKKAASSPTLAQQAPSSVPPALVTPTSKVWASHGIVGEPIFIPRRQAATDAAGPEEDAGWLFVQV